MLTAAAAATTVGGPPPCGRPAGGRPGNRGCSQPRRRSPSQALGVGRGLNTARDQRWTQTNFRSGQFRWGFPSAEGGRRPAEGGSIGAGGHPPMPCGARLASGAQWHRRGERPLLPRRLRANAQHRAAARRLMHRSSSVAALLRRSRRRGERLHVRERARGRGRGVRGASPPPLGAPLGGGLPLGRSILLGDGQARRGHAGDLRRGHPPMLAERLIQGTHSRNLADCFSRWVSAEDIGNMAAPH